MGVSRAVRQLVAAYPDVQFTVATSSKLPGNCVPAWMYTVGAVSPVSPQTLATLQLAGLNLRPFTGFAPMLRVYRLAMDSLCMVTCDVSVDSIWHFVDFKPPAPLAADQASGHPVAAALLTPQATVLAHLVDRLCTVLQGADYVAVGQYLRSVADQRYKEEVYRYTART